MNSVRLSDATLERIATILSDFYFVYYEEPAVNSSASLTRNMLAFVFDGGLSTPDERLLRSGRVERLREFRQNFFEVVSGELVELVGGLTGVAVTYSFYGFDPKTRTTHAIFVLDTSRPYGAEERQAVVNWSEQVRRNARRLWRERGEARDSGQSPG